MLVFTFSYRTIVFWRVAMRVAIQSFTTEFGDVGVGGILSSILFHY